MIFPKSKTTNTCYIVRYDNFFISTSRSVQQNTVYNYQRIFFLSCSQPRRILKSISANAGHTAWNCNLCQTRATIKNTISDICYTIRNDDTCQTRATIKSTISDTRHRFPVNLCRNFQVPCRIIFTICNFYSILGIDSIGQLRCSCSHRNCHCVCSIIFRCTHRQHRTDTSQHTLQAGYACTAQTEHAGCNRCEHFFP